MGVNVVHSLARSVVAVVAADTDCLKLYGVNWRRESDQAR
jgi:hypothetical protein